MRKLAAVILLAVIGFFIFSSLYGVDDSTYGFSHYGEANLETRVSDKMVTKSVRGNDDPVTYKETADAESGSANLVTSIVVNYRSFDTLGEVTVLFISALGVALLLGTADKRAQFKASSNFILNMGSKMAVGIIVMVGVYIFTHGHLTPGGGFPGGSMIASAVLLLYIADNKFRIKLHALKIAEGIGGSLYVLAGIGGLIFGGYFLYNFLPNGIVGNLFSAGLIPVIYILIALKVGAELSGILTNFLSEGVEH